MFSAKSRSNVLPGRVTTLSVSWLNNQFKAVAVQRGVITGTWESAEPSEGPRPFTELLGEAVRQTGYHGLTVSLVLAHARLVQQLTDVPPVKGAALKRILHRQALQQKMFAGHAAWSWQPTLAGEGGDRVVMHLMPRPLVEQLIEACRAQGLFLVSATPASTVLQRQLKQLPLEKGESAVLAAHTGNSTTVVIGRADGKLVLARTLPGTWSENPGRLGLDLNRTILFVSQQYGVTVNGGLWLFGPGSQEQLPAIQRSLQVPVKLSPVEAEPFYWAREGATLQPELCPNFVTPEQQQAVQRQNFARVIAVATLLVVLALTGVSVYAFFQARQETDNIRVLSQQHQRLQAKAEEAHRWNAFLAAKQEVSQRVLDDRLPPAPAWFLGYLSEAVPAELVVTNLHLTHEERQWKVEMSGTYQTSLGEPTPENFSKAVGVLSERLTEGPFHLKLITERDKEKAAPRAKGNAGNAVPEWVANVASGVPAKLPSINQFTLEGVMQ